MCARVYTFNDMVYSQSPKRVLYFVHILYRYIYICSKYIYLKNKAI